MNLRTVFVLCSILAVPMFSLDAQVDLEQQPLPMPQATDKLARLRLDVSRLKASYADRYVDPSSADYAVFQEIGTAALASPELIDALIDLCVIKEAPPKTFEKYTPMRLSPAGRELMKLGALAKDRIEESLKSSSITDWQRSILSEVMDSLDRASESGASSSQDLPSPRLRTTELEQERNLPDTSVAQADINAVPPSPPIRQSVSETKPMPATPSKKPPLSTRWPVVAVVVVAALGLLWVLLKKRK